MKLSRLISALLIIFAISLSAGCSSMDSDGASGSMPSGHSGY